jgi:hypothetical protein
MRRWLAIFGVLVLAAVVAVPVARRWRADQCDAIFEKVQPGMTVQQVNAVLGRPGDEQDIGGTWIVRWRWKDSMGDDIAVIVLLDGSRQVSGRFAVVDRSDGRRSIRDDGKIVWAN